MNELTSLNEYKGNEDKLDIKPQIITIHRPQSNKDSIEKQLLHEDKLGSLNKFENESGQIDRDRVYLKINCEGFKENSEDHLEAEKIVNNYICNFMYPDIKINGLIKAKYLFYEHITPIVIVEKKEDSHEN